MVYRAFTLIVFAMILHAQFRAQDGVKESRNIEFLLRGKEPGCVIIEDDWATSFPAGFALCMQEKIIPEFQFFGQSSHFLSGSEM